MQISSHYNANILLYDRNIYESYNVSQSYKHSTMVE